MVKSSKVESGCQARYDGVSGQVTCDNFVSCPFRKPGSGRRGRRSLLPTPPGVRMTSGRISLFKRMCDIVRGTS